MKYYIVWGEGAAGPWAAEATAADGIDIAIATGAVVGWEGGQWLSGDRWIVTIPASRVAPSDLDYDRAVKGYVTATTRQYQTAARTGTGTGTGGMK